MNERKYHVVSTIDGWCVNDKNETRVAGPFQSPKFICAPEDSGQQQAIRVCAEMNLQAGFVPEGYGYE